MSLYPPILDSSVFQEEICYWLAIPINQKTLDAHIIVAFMHSNHDAKHLILVCSPRLS
jgi:hypothetical protein